MKTPGVPEPGIGRCRWSALHLLGLLVLVLQPPEALSHQNTRAFGFLALTQESAQLVLYALFQDWEQAVEGLDVDQDGEITKEELQIHEQAINGRVLRAVTARNGLADCPASAALPALGMRHGKLYVKTELDFQCTRTIRRFTLGYDLFTKLHPGHRMLASIQAPDLNATHVFMTDPEQPAEYTVLVAGPPPPMSETVLEFLGLGVDHIFTGYDHILFLLALIVIGGRLLDLVKVVTAFTLAHSVTLALAALEVVTLSAKLVEPVIALSIVVVATENLVFQNRFAHLRMLVSFVFGLVHGFGFASVLTEMDIAKESVLASLLGFNLGVEIGQVAIVALIYPVLRWLQRQDFRLRAVRGISAIILVMSLWWLLDRTLGV